MKKHLLALALGVMVLLQPAAQADDYHFLVDRIKQVNNGRFAGANIEVLRPVPLASLKDYYEVSIDGQILLIHANGSDAILGEAYDLDRMVNLTREFANERMAKMAGAEIGKLPEENFVTFRPEGEVKGTLYVFTDVTCGYCKKLHREIDQFMAAGVEVRYIPYPRGGLNEGSQGYETAKQFMCADDRQQALTALKAGTAGNNYVQAQYDAKCVEQVAQGYRTGGNIGIQGTPLLYLSNGMVIPGYQPADKVAALF